MKKIYTLIAYLLFITPVSAQYFEWINELQQISNRGVYFTDFIVSKNGKCYVINSGQGCQAGCHFDTYTQVSDLGIGVGSNNGFTTWTYQQIAIDNKSSVILSGYNFGNTPVIISGKTIQPQTSFLMKNDSNGVLKWIKTIPNNSVHYLACDQNDNIYSSDGLMIEKRNTSGNILWTNLTIGGDIQIDGNNKINVISGNNLIKLNGNNSIAWTKSLFNSGKLAVQKNGNAFILTNDSLIKYNASGNKVWGRSVLSGNYLAIDTLGRIIIADTNTIYRISANGNSVQWTLSTIHSTIQGLGINLNGDPYLICYRSLFEESILCPFRPNVNSLASSIPVDEILITKINTTNTIPFQAGIFTDKLPVFGTYGSGNFLCTGKSFSIPFSYCTNSISNFNPGNQFIVELLGGPVSPLNIGDPSNYIVPKTIPAGLNYRLRVSSTNPYIEGYPNLPDFYNSNIRIYPTIASITPSGNTNFCQGNSITLKATTDPFYNYSWLRNDTVIVSQGLDSVITASINGIYKLVTIDKFCGCTDTANINVTVNNLPSVTITASGPLSFCNGDSVVLTANSGLGFTYQWKVNGVNIPFAFYQSYVAKQAGTFKVKVGNSYGCTKVSSAKTVAIVCKEDENIINENAYNYYIADNTLTILNKSSLKINASLYSINGALIENEINILGSSTGSFNIERFSTGMYFLKIIQDNEVHWEKVVFER